MPSTFGANQYGKLQGLWLGLAKPFFLTETLPPYDHPLLNGISRVNVYVMVQHISEGTSLNSEGWERSKLTTITIVLIKQVGQMWSNLWQTFWVRQPTTLLVVAALSPRKPTGCSLLSCYLLPLSSISGMVRLKHVYMALPHPLPTFRHVADIICGWHFTFNTQGLEKNEQHNVLAAKLILITSDCEWTSARVARRIALCAGRQNPIHLSLRTHTSTSPLTT